MEGQALFHPLKFLHWAAEGLTVYEDTPVTAVRGDEVLTPKGKVRAEHIVFAAHYPFVNLPGFYFTRLHQERSYAVALKGTGELDGAYYGVDPGGLSLRPFGSMVLLGGGRTPDRGQPGRGTVPDAGGQCRTAVAKLPGGSTLVSPGLHHTGRSAIYRAPLAQPGRGGMWPPALASGE